MKEVNFNSGNGWCYIAFDGAKKGLVSYEEEEILPCEFDFISTHIGEIWATIQYKNVLFRFWNQSTIPDRKYYPSYEEETFFVFGEKGLFSIETAPSSEVEEFCRDCEYNPSLKYPEMERSVIDVTFKELCDLLSNNHSCTKEEYQKRRKL